MGRKVTKREKKFNASGGVKARLEKAGRTITKKGRLTVSVNKKRKARQRNREEREEREEEKNRRNNNKAGKGGFDDGDDGFLGDKNMKGMDIDSFFDKMTQEIEEEEQEAKTQKETHRKDSKAKKKKGKKYNHDEMEEEEQEERQKQDEGSSDNNDDRDDEDDVMMTEKQMMKEMKKMERKDPEFHQYLQENERSLLEFGEDDDDDDQSSGSDDEDEEENVKGMKMKSDCKQKEKEKGGGKKKGSSRAGDDEIDEDEEEESSDEDGSDHDGEEEEEKAEDDGEKDGRSAFTLTHKVLESMERGAFASHSIKTLRRLVVGAYQTACYMSSSSTTSSSSSRGGASSTQYIIKSSKVFDRLMVLCLDRCHEEFRYHLLGATRGSNNKNKKQKQKKGKKQMGARDDDDSSDEENRDDGVADEGEGDDRQDDVDVDNKPVQPRLMENSEQWSPMRKILTIFIKSTLHVLGESKEPELLAFVLKALSKYLPLLSALPNLAETSLKTFVNLWSNPSLDDDGDDNNDGDDKTKKAMASVRLHAFFRIRQLALTQPFPFIENCLKKTYLSYAKRAKFATGGGGGGTSRATALTFMGNCLVELYGIDAKSSYQHAFVYIRQLALHLRTAMQKKTRESFQNVYCWQYLNCLKLWTAVLSHTSSTAASGEDGIQTDAASAELMKSLVYPLSEVIQGTARLPVSSPVRYLPTKYHCVRLLQQLASSTESFIPTTPVLLDILDHKEWYTRPKKSPGSGKSKGISGSSSAQGIQLRQLIRFHGKDDALRTQEQLDAAMNEWFVLIHREIELYRYSVGFPEFSVRIVQRLRQFVKDVQQHQSQQQLSTRWKSYGRGCVETCEKYSTNAVRERAKIRHETPRDVPRLEFLLPASQPNMKLRHDADVEKEYKLTMESGRYNTKTKSSKRQRSDQDENHEEVEKPPKKTKKEKQIASQTKKAKKMKESGATASSDDEGDALDEEDEVREGIDWSDEEDENEGDEREDDEDSDEDDEDDNKDDSDDDA